MSKTLEIELADDDSFSITSPDHDEKFSGDEYTIDADEVRDTSFVDGITTIDILNDKYFHIEESKGENYHSIVITVEDYPQKNEFLIPYGDRYTFNEKVTELGVPETDEGYDNFKYCPSVKLECKLIDGDREVTGVKISNTMYDMVERDSE